MDTEHLDLRIRITYDSRRGHLLGFGLDFPDGRADLSRQELQEVAEWLTTRAARWDTGALYARARDPRPAQEAPNA